MPVTIKRKPKVKFVKEEKNQIDVYLGKKWVAQINVLWAGSGKRTVVVNPVIEGETTNYGRLEFRSVQVAQKACEKFLCQPWYLHMDTKE